MSFWLLVKGIMLIYILVVFLIVGHCAHCTSWCEVIPVVNWLESASAYPFRINSARHNHSDTRLVSEWRKFQQRMADSISNGSENEEMANQFSALITRSRDTQTNTIESPSSPCRWTRTKTNAADTGIAPPYSLRHRRNLTSVSKVCEAAPISLIWVTNRLNEWPVVPFKFPFIQIGKIDNGFCKGPNNKDFSAVSQTYLTRV